MSDLVNEILKDSDSKMNKAVEVAREDFGAIRTGRAHPSMFAKIMVDYYGTFTPLSQLASVQVPEARIAVVSPYDKGAMAIIEKYDSYWMEIVGTRGFKGKKAKNARTMAAKHLHIEGNTAKDKPEKKEQPKPSLHLFEGLE